MSRPVALIGALSLAFPAAALAHGAGSGGGSFTSRVTAVRPDVGITVQVTGGDDRLRLENTSGKQVVIEGYGGEPYLRFTADGVFENERSPAAFLNRDRWGDVAVPRSASEDAAPRWRKVADGRSYAWYDHRIHWMSRNETAPAVRMQPDTRNTIFAWAVPGRAGSTAFTIGGSLEYVPGDDFPWLFVTILGTLLLAFVVGLLVFIRVRMRPS